MCRHTCGTIGQTVRYYATHKAHLFCTLRHLTFPCKLLQKVSLKKTMIILSIIACAMIGNVLAQEHLSMFVAQEGSAQDESRSLRQKRAYGFGLGFDPNNFIRHLIVQKLYVRSDIQFRYARTQVESTVENPSILNQEAYFEMVLPESAFISNFTIETGGKVYISRV